MDVSDWDARIETWLAGRDDDLSGVVDLLLMDFSWEEDEDENEMSTALPPACASSIICRRNSGA